MLGLGDGGQDVADTTGGGYATCINCDSSSAGSSVGTTFNWGALATATNSFSNAFSNIFKSIQGPLPSGCIQVAGPYGVSTQCGNTSSQPQLSLSNTASSLGISSSTLLLGVGAVVLVMMMKK